MTSSLPANTFDTGPLSWVIGEIRDALERSGSALNDAAARSFEAQPTLLLHAKTHLHQAHGALQMVDVEGVGLVTAAAERALDGFKDRSLACTPDNAKAVRDAYGAIGEYLEELVAGAAPQPARLFPYYRALQELLGAERIHPSDLLVVDTALTLDLPAPPDAGAPDYAGCRARFEKSLLPYLKSTDPQAQRQHAQALADAIAPLAQSGDARARTFWTALHGFADLVAAGALPADLYVKQLFGQVNLQLRRLSQGQAGLPDAMLRDALFFVAAAAQAEGEAAELRRAFRLEGAVPANYAERRYGKVDPAALKEAKEALARSKSDWDQLAVHADDTREADFNAALATLAGASDKLGAPALAQLLRELGQAASDSIASGRSDQFGLEMAAAMLFVEHGLDQVRQLPEDFDQHAEVVGQRLLALAAGETPPDAPQWQNELAGRIQQGQTVAVLAGEIKGGLRQVEKLLDEYYDQPQLKRGALDAAAPLLHQIEGALRILDQDEAARAAVHVRDAVRALGQGDGDVAAQAAPLHNIARNIGALGFFTDMLAQNSESAKVRFAFDEEAGLLRELSIEQAQEHAAGQLAGQAGAQDAESAAAPAFAAEPAAEFAADPAPAPPQAAAQPDAIDAELLEIFVTEAGEVLDVVAATLPQLHANPAAQDALTIVRRAFHTLKGSARMVGLDDFAAAAAALERVMNVWLADSRAATPDLLALAAHAHAQLLPWVAELAQAGQSARNGATLIAAAERVQAGGAFVPEQAPAPGTGQEAPQDLAAGEAPQAGEPEPVEAATEPRAPEAAEPAETEAAPAPTNVFALPTATRPAPAQDDSVRRVGALEIPLALYNIYVAETDELLRTLERDFGEWRHEPGRDVTPDALKAVHTLAGTSATVGFEALRDLAQALETTLEHLGEPAPQLAPQQHDVLDAVLARVRQMLQAFAQGELAPSQPELLAQLDALREQLSEQISAQQAEDLYGDVPQDLAARLDTLFAQTYDSLMADPPPVQEPTEPAPAPAAQVSADDDIDALFGLDIDDLFDAPVLQPAAPAEEMAEPAPETVTDTETLAAAEADFADSIELAEPEPIELPISLDLAAPEEEEAQDLAPAAAGEEASLAESLAVPELEAVALPVTLDESLAAPALAAEPALHDELDSDLLPVFLEEAADLLPQIGNGLRQWQQDPQDTAPAQGLLRTLHTVKGSARMAGAMRIGQHTHELETQVENMVHAGTTAPSAFDELMASYDQALVLFEQLVKPAAAPEAAGADVDNDVEQTQAGVPAPARLPAAPVAEVQTEARTPLVRVRADILDRLVTQAGEVSITRSRLENQMGVLKTALNDFSDNLGRLRRQLREVEMQAESQIASRMSIAGEREFDPLEFDRFTRLQELTRMMAESVNDVASFQESLARSVDGANEELAAQSRMTRDLQRDLMRVRMVPFASLSERLFRVARQTAKETDKRVNLDIRGGGVEIDRSVLEQMAAPFEHLLRNAIVHGIEPRAARTQAGKNETGEVLVQVSQQGNEVVLQFSDDGAGLDLERIRAKARAVGLVEPEAEIGDKDAAELIFAPGFSTADTLTELAGRGVGMDVVRSEAQALGGRVVIASSAGEGTRFTIHLPLTLAVTQVVLVASAGKTYALPSTLVEQVQPVREPDLAAAAAAGVLEVQGQVLPFHYLPALLGEAETFEPGLRSRPVMLLHSGGERIALQVDEVLGNREVVIKNLGPQLARVPGIAGATVLGSGDIVLILNPLALGRNAGTAAPMIDVPLHPVPAVHKPTVMVVDDSLTVRRVTQRFLEREGYRVALAKDGVDALEQLPEVRPDLMLVDIEMPRMDGFDLVRHVRSDASTQAIPVIMITSRTADKHRNYAMGLGVNAYFGKPFQEPVLLGAIAGLLGGEMPPAD
ncbi:Hpt domain-containing protein [Massilia sp. YIM B02769]|uniref:hybrid sensor histidine kinase/response regulator n=1 Tax=Massilia sp. YIM B02769 TaxID=3050129 RepID=UPI0025B72B46|nr:hybrid sensor histidine kinase/response regulator [Massilia sp. YIM B02769]MDN4057921.1 Hpt domain-containing protein [Massilia sp. YIM B02769]